MKKFAKISFYGIAVLTSMQTLMLLATSDWNPREKAWLMTAVALVYMHFRAPSVFPPKE